MPSSIFELPLTNTELVAKVSEEDYVFLMFYTWMLNKSSGYVKCNSRALDKRPLHLIIASRMKISGEVIDHKDRDKLNCIRDNLRPATRSQSNINRQLHNPNGFRGVMWHHATQKWQASIWKDRQIIYLGCFEEIEDAAKAYDAEAKLLHGEFAQLNFKEVEDAK